MQSDSGQSLTSFADGDHIKSIRDRFLTKNIEIIVSYDLIVKVLTTRCK